MRIEKFHTSHLHNDAHFQFMTEFRDLVVRCGAQNLKIAPQFNEWMALYGREDDALKKIVRSPLTEQIHEADKARDDIYSAIVEINDAYHKHYDSDIAAAARRLKIVFDTYGNIAKKSLNEQTSAIYNLLQDLRSPKYIGDIQIAGFSPWIAELDKRNKHFEHLVKERYDESVSKTSVVVRDARKETDETYRKICEVINVYAYLEGEAAYETFVRTLNVIIVKYGGKPDKSMSGRTSSDYSPDSVGGGSHGGGAGGGAQYDPPLYDPNKHYTEYSVGDVVRLPDGSVWRVKDLGHIHYAPDSEYGHLGWERVY